MNYIYAIDINCDLGEGTGNDAEIMPYISSCNIACGGHAGDRTSIQDAIQLAKKEKVKVGAHPSFPDKENFGREKLDMNKDQLKKSIEEQLILIKEVCLRENIFLNHIKPHGALYHLCNTDKEYAQLIIDVVKEVAPKSYVYAPAKSAVTELADGQVSVFKEGFADRNYNDDHTLVSRNKKHALIIDKEVVFEHVFRMISERKIKTKNNNFIPIDVDTICIHGDTQNAVEIVKFLNRNLAQKGVHIT